MKVSVKVFLHIGHEWCLTCTDLIAEVLIAMNTCHGALINIVAVSLDALGVLEGKQAGVLPQD